MLYKLCATMREDDRVIIIVETHHLQLINSIVGYFSSSEHISKFTIVSVDDILGETAIFEKDLSNNANLGKTMKLK